MNKYPLIEKASGERQEFKPEKLKNSLKRAGASDDIAYKIVEEISAIIEAGFSTKEIYKKAFKLLKTRKSSNAARYSLKNAIMELGPTGYPFEHFVAQVLAANGFDIKVGQKIQGKCITHEIDVVATYNNTQYLVECKFYNSHGKYARVQVPLYVRSRVDDIIQFREKIPEYKETRFYGWVVTNTRFTTDALYYGRCAGLHMLSWDAPKNKGLKDMIEKQSIFPVTVLTNLNKKNKIYLLDKGVVLCRQLKQKPEILDELPLKKNIKSKIMQQLDELCKQ